MTLKFLRLNRAMVAWINLEKVGFTGRYVNRFVLSYTTMALKTFCISVTMAGVILVVETLGEPQIFRTTSTPTAMGDISLLTMFYWVFTTITTVGYGDYTPKTNLSRIITILYIVAGVLFFTIETERLLHMLGQLHSGKGDYEGHTKHVLVSGGGANKCDPLMLVFLKELLASGPTFSVVVVVTGEVDPRYYKAMDSSWSHGRLSVLSGTVLDLTDLIRMQCYEASMAFIIADSTSVDPDQEDGANILCAANINRVAPDLRLRLMVLRPANKLIALSMGIAQHKCYSLYEMKASLMAMSCRCPGYSSLVLNFFLGDPYMEALKADQLQFKKLSTWQQQYFGASNKSFLGVLIHEDYVGLTFGVAAKMIYQRSNGGAIMIALQADDGPLIFPHSSILREDDIVFLVSDDFKSAAKAAKKRVKKMWEDALGKMEEKALKEEFHSWKFVIDYKPQYFERMRLRDAGEAGREALREKELERTVDLMVQHRSTGPQVARKRSHKTVSFQRLKDTERELNLEREVSKPAVVKTDIHIEGDAGALTQEFSETRDLGRNSKLTQRKQEEVQHAAAMVKERGHILLLLCQDKLWQQVTAFIKVLRSDELHFFRNIIVMGPSFPPIDLWDAFDDVAFVVGNPVNRDDLISVGGHVADKVCLFAGQPTNESELKFVDRMPMIVISQLEIICAEAQSDTYTIIEFLYVENSQVLPPVPLSCRPRGWESSSRSILRDEVDEDASTHSQPRYAAGRIFTPAAIGALYGQAYQMPGVLEVLEALVLPSSRGQKTFPLQLPPLEWIASDYIGKTFGELAEGMLENGLGMTYKNEEGDVISSAIMPLGLYRRTEDTDKKVDGVMHVTSGLKRDGDRRRGQDWRGEPTQLGAAYTGMRFVFTKPGYDEPLLPGDHVFVLAPAGWGQKVMPAAERLIQERTPSRYMFKDFHTNLPEDEITDNKGWMRPGPVAFCGERERPRSPLRYAGTLAGGVFEGEDVLDQHIGARRAAVNEVPSGSWMDLMACGSNRSSVEPKLPFSDT